MVPRKMRILDANADSIWRKFAGLFANDSNTWDPVLIDGAPCLGPLPKDFLSKGQLNNREREQEQIGLVLAWLCKPDVLDGFDESYFESDGGKPAAREAVGFYNRLLHNFGSADERSRYQQAVREARQLEGVVTLKPLETLIDQMNLRLLEIEPPDSVEFWISSIIELERYDPEQARFQFRVRGTPILISRTAKSFGIELNYEPPIATPASFDVAVEQAHGFLQRTGSKRCIVLTKVRLSVMGGTFDGNLRGLYRTARAEVLSMNLHKQSANLELLHQWELGKEPDRQPDGIKDVADDAIGARMKLLAEQFGIERFKDALVLRTDSLKMTSSAWPVWQRRFGILMDRIEIGLSEDVVNPLFAAHHLPDVIGTAIEVRRYQGQTIEAEWSGKNEFEKRDSRLAFFSNNRERIDSLKIDSTLRVAVLTKLTLPPYDFEREGFELLGLTNKQAELIFSEVKFINYCFPGPVSFDRRHFQVRTRPALIDTFLPMSPERARALVAAKEDRREIFLAAIFDLLPVPSDVAGNDLGSSVANLKSVTLYTDNRFLDKLAELPEQ